MSAHEDDEAAYQQTAEDIELYMQQEAEREQEEFERVFRNNVVPIRPNVVEQHTDSELVELSPAELLYSRFSFDAEEALQEAHDKQWLIDGLIPSGGFGALYGKPGSYKSFVALDMAACISLGIPWHGIDCDSPGLVLYVAAEGAYGLQQRKRAWEVHHGRSLTNRLVVLPQGVMMDELMQAQALIEAVQMAEAATGMPIRLIVIDTFARTFNGDENSAKETGIWINASGRVASALNDCTVMMVTHTTKAEGGGIRGSSALPGACDFIYEVRRPKGAELQVLVRNEKQKDTDEAETMLFALDKVSIGRKDPKGRDMQTLVLMLEDRGDDADPEGEQEEVSAAHESAFDAADMNRIVAMVRIAYNAGNPLTESACRKEYIGDLISGGMKPNTARASWRRNYQKATIAFGMIYKKGAHLVLSSTDKI